MFQAIKDFVSIVQPKEPERTTVHAPQPSFESFIIERVIEADTPTPISVGVFVSPAMNGPSPAIRLRGEPHVSVLLRATAPTSEELTYEFEGNTILDFRACKEAPSGVCYRLRNGAAAADNIPFMPLRVPWKPINFITEQLDRIEHLGFSADCRAQLHDLTYRIQNTSDHNAPYKGIYTVEFHSPYRAVYSACKEEMRRRSRVM